jgi:hypothetical protein
MLICTHFDSLVLSKESTLRYIQQKIIKHVLSLELLQDRRLISRGTVSARAPPTRPHTAPHSRLGENRC